MTEQSLASLIPSQTAGRVFSSRTGTESAPAATATTPPNAAPPNAPESSPPPRSRSATYDAAETLRANLLRQGVPRRAVNAVETLTPSGPWAEKYATLRSQLGTGFIYAILGDRGVGKTCMAAALVRDALVGMGRNEHDAARPRYARAMDWFIDIRRAFKPDGPSESETMKAWYQPNLLVIDEIHLRGETAWEDRLLANMIDHRYGDVKDTLVISNLTWEEFAKSVDPSIVSRIQETGGRVVCQWESFRGK